MKLKGVRSKWHLNVRGNWLLRDSTDNQRGIITKVLKSFSSFIHDQNSVDFSPYIFKTSCAASTSSSLENEEKRKCVRFNDVLISNWLNVLLVVWCPAHSLPNASSLASFRCNIVSLRPPNSIINEWNESTGKKNVIHAGFFAHSFMHPMPGSTRSHEYEFPLIRRQSRQLFHAQTSSEAQEIR